MAFPFKHIQVKHRAAPFGQTVYQCKQGFGVYVVDVVVVVLVGECFSLGIVVELLETGVLAHYLQRFVDGYAPKP